MRERMCTSVSSYSDRTDTRPDLSRKLTESINPRSTNSPDETVLDEGRRVRIRTCIAKPLHGARRLRSQWRRSSLACFPRVSRARFRVVVPTPVLNQGSVERTPRRRFHVVPVRILRTRRHCRIAASTSETCHN